MKSSIKKKICLCLLTVISVFFVVTALFTSMCFQKNNGGVNKEHKNEEILNLKVGEEIPLAQANEEFASFFTNNGYYVDKITCVSLLNNGKVYQPNCLPASINEKGNIYANEVGIFELTYTVYANKSIKNNQNVYYASDEHLFVNVILVSEQTENLIPFNAEEFDAKANYILTEDVFLSPLTQKRLYDSNFYGSIINPNGYTITLQNDGINSTPALFETNYGILNGINLNVISNAENPFKDSFYGLAQQNLGVITNCNLTGEVVIKEDLYDYDQSKYFSVYPNNGFTYSNKANLTVYSDGNIKSYYSPTFEIPNNPKWNNIKNWQFKNNTVTLECFYLTDLVKCRQRNPEFYPNDNDNLTLHPVWGENKEWQDRRIVINLPRLYGEYYTISTYVQRNTLLEIPIKYWQEVLWGANEQLSDLKVEYWKVNGEIVESLDGIVINDSLTTIEPCVKWTTTKYITTSNPYYYQLENVQNSISEVCYLSPGYNVTLNNDFFYEFFSDPRNVIPEKIVINKDCSITHNFSTNIITDNSTYALQNYILQGGKLEVEDGHDQLVLINNSMLCTDKGKTLIKYFFTDQEKTVILHPQIEKVENRAFCTGVEFTEIDFSNAKTISAGCLADITTLEKVRFGSDFKISAVDSNTENPFFELLGGFKNLTDIKIDENNKTYYSDNNFIIQNYLNDINNPLNDRILVFGLPSLSGKVELPEKINGLIDYAFACSDISCIVFNETPVNTFNFNEGALKGMQKLESIQFGNFTNFNDMTQETVELPALTNITFSNDLPEVQLWFSPNSFMGANLTTVSIPKNTIFITVGPSCEKFEVDPQSDYFTVENDIVYSKDKTKLFAYPNKKQTDTLTLENISFIQPYAFHSANIKRVILDNAILVSRSAFENSAIEEIEFKTFSDLTLSDYAFKGCEKLSKVTFANEINVTVEQYAFSECKALQEIDYNKIVSIGEFAFSFSGIEYFEFSSKIENLERSAFLGSNIKEAVFTNDYTNYLPGYLFSNCENLKTVDLGGASGIGEKTFYASGIEKIESSNVKFIDNSAFANCTNLTSVNCENSNSLYENAFQNCSNLESIYLPQTDKAPYYAFYKCVSLSQITLAQNITVETSAFAYCSNLQNLNSVVTEIGYESFSNCNSLKEIHYSNQLDRKVNIDNFTNVSENFKLYLNVSENFFLEGVIPQNITVYLPEELIDKFASEWIVQKEQLVAYDFA